MNIIEQAKKVLKIESKAVANLIERIDTNFLQAVELLADSKGTVIVTGMGKSGIIGKKIAATLTSIGTPAFFLHPAEGIHGDSGVLLTGEIVVAISNSGETPELISLLDTIKFFNLKLISLLGKVNSTLAEQSDLILNISVKEEACPLGLVPTASTTATLAMGDALAIALLTKKGLKAEDFVLFHPGGNLGKRLLIRVKDLMHTDQNLPRVKKNDLLKNVILEISAKRLGVTTVIDERGILQGIITDGDLRRVMNRKGNIFKLKAAEIMTTHPKIITQDALAAEGLKIMEQFSITSLLIVDSDKKPQGIIHLHDILKAGIG